MRICLAQTRPIKGDVEANIKNHLALTGLAVSNSADIIIFPELSITGYEPTLAKGLATTPDDSRFDLFQKISDEKNILIGIGTPLKKDEDITISLVLFAPNEKRKTYSKQFLHPDEDPFFVAGEKAIGLLGENTNIALAICYELSVAAHAENAFNSGAKIYLASVAKTAEGMNKAHDRLACIAKQYSATVLVVNCIGLCDGAVCGGRSAIWNEKGDLTGQLDDDQEGILFMDTDTGDVFEKYG